jgi:serine protease inhibitor
MRQRNHNCRTTVGLLLAAAALSACGGSSMNSSSMSPTPPPSSTPPSTVTQSVPPAVMQAMNAGTAVNPALVTADNTFALNLFQNLNAGTSGNMAIAPISVAMALQILFNGAAGTTQQAMAQTLDLGAMSTSDLNNANAALQGSLMNADPNVQIIIANSLWLHLSDTPVLSSFTQMDENYYGATVGDLAGAPANVNNWVSSETNGLITQILPTNVDYNAVTAVLANVIYFKGQWTTAFDPSQTNSAPFTLADGSSVSVEMMHETGNFQYLAGADFQAVSLPYGQGRLSMLIVLPNSGTPLSSFVASMTPDAVNGWVGQMQSVNGAVALPRFTATYSVSLPPALTVLGMGIAFCSSMNSDFSALATPPPNQCISDVEHKTVVEVDESGTVAAGATTITVTPTAVMAPAFTITMDQPFLYVIRDDQTGELLFIGAMMNPTAG